MYAVFADEQLAHAPDGFLVAGSPQPSPEIPERAEILGAAARGAGCKLIRPEDPGLGPIAAVHTPRYLCFLQTAHDRWRALPGASEQIRPNAHPVESPAGYPESVVGQAGWHMADMAAPIGQGAWEAIRWSAAAAAHAAGMVAAGAERAVYALCRPPGHHAFAERAGGFCFVNNCAVAVEILRKTLDRICVLDIDVHHGNGTQGIFYRRADVLTVSLHGDPAHFYPFFQGYAGERGADAGAGYNLNLPLPRGTGDEDYLPALEIGLATVRAFSPGALVVALGLDAHEGDPLAFLKITTGGFARIASPIGALDLPTVLVQEGGYMNAALGPNLASFLDGFREGVPRKLGVSST